MVQLAKAEKTQISFGEERDIPVTVASIATYTITTDPPTTMIDDLYIGCEFQIKNCAGNTALNNTRYIITDNTDNDITIDTDLSSDVTANDTAVIVAFGAPPLNTTAKADTDDWMGILSEGADLPEPDYDIKFYRTIGSDTRDWSIAEDGFISCTGSLPITLQNGKILKYLFGRIYETGTDVDGGGGSDLDGAVEAGDTTVTLTAATNYAVDDYIQIDTPTDAEIRKITAVNGNVLTLDRSLDRDHADATTCNEVESPYTHVITGANRIPTFTLESVIEMDSDFIVLYQGCASSKGDFSGEEKGELKYKTDIIASRPFKSSGTANTVSALSTKPYMFHQAVFTYFGSIIARIKSWSLSVDNKIEPGVYWRSNEGAYMQDPIENEREYLLTTTVNIVDTTVWDQLASRGDLTCQIDFTRGTNDTLQIKCENCQFKSSPHKIPDKGAIPVEMTLIPKTVTITIVDSVTPY